MSNSFPKGIQQLIPIGEIGNKIYFVDNTELVSNFKLGLYQFAEVL